MTTTLSAAGRHVRAHAIPLATLDPDAPLDDLEPLREVIGDARVVALGENTHHVREFFVMRHRLCRFLVERCGFTHFAAEAPFSEGIPLAAWVAGDGQDGDGDALIAAGMHSDMGLVPEMREHLRWLRAYNRTAERPVAYFGTDCPATLASLAPALEPVEAYLADVDPATQALVAQARELAAGYAGGNLFESIPRYDAMPQERRHELSALLSWLLRRFEYMRGHYVRRTDERAYDLAYRCLRSAWVLDMHQGELHGIWHEGDWIVGKGSTRDHFMAESIDWLLERSAPDAKIVLAAHNAHLQRTPWAASWQHAEESEGSETLVARDGDGIDHYPLGAYLAERFGDEYVVFAATSGGGETVVMDRGEDWHLGLRLEPAPVGPPAEGSLEAVLAAVQPGLSAVDLRPLRGDPEARIERMQMSEAFVELPVAEAFDGVVHVPETSPSDYVHWVVNEHAAR